MHDMTVAEAVAAERAKRLRAFDSALETFLNTGRATPPVGNQRLIIMQRCLIEQALREACLAFEYATRPRH